MVEIRQGDFTSFFRAPLEVYPRDSGFVTPLASELGQIVDFQRNPFFEPGSGTIYSALRQGRPVGRIAVFVHAEANQRFAENCCSFGYFDCADDVAIARALLLQAVQFARARNCDRLRGNMNMTANQEIGVVTEHHGRRPFLAQIWNPPHIPRLLEGFGFQRSKEMTSFMLEDVGAQNIATLIGPKQQALLNDSRFSSRALDLKQFPADLEIIRQILNAGMDKNYLFCPMTSIQAQFQLGPVKDVVDPDLIRFAFLEGRPVGVTLAVPDFNPILGKLRGSLWPLGWWTLLRERKKIRDATAIIIIVLPEFQNLGIIRLLNYQMMDALQKKGYRRLAGTWIGDDNPASLRSAEALGMKPYHRLAIYEMRLEP